MKPYNMKLTARPGCACCNNKYFHKFSGPKTASIKRSRRAGNKRARQQGRREIAQGGR